MPKISRRTFLHSSCATAVSSIAVSSIAVPGLALGRVGRPMRQVAATLPMPPLLSGRRDGDRYVYELTAQRGSTEILPGMPTETFGYNGSMLGPMIRMRRGDEVVLNVANQLGEPTTCHWHGLHVPAVADGGPHQIIEPDTTWQASFKVMNEAATYWYHSHLEGRTGEQVYKGLAGMIIVDDPALEGLELPRRYGIDDFPLVIQDRRFSSDGELLYLQMGMDAMMGMMGNRLSMATGERYEVIVDLSELAGDTLHLMSYPSADSPGFPILDIAVDPDIEVVPVRLPETLRAAPQIDETAVSRTRQFDLSMGMGMGMMGGGMGGGRGMGGGGMGGGGGRGGGGGGHGMGSGGMPGRGPGGFTINDVSMDMDVVNETVKLGAVEEWRISNHSSMTHPFHIHDVQFLVHSRNGSPPPAHERGWKDTVQVRPDETVSILAHFIDYADPVRPYMYHCHILEHEDRGMMGQFVVVE